MARFTVSVSFMLILSCWTICSTAHTLELQELEIRLEAKVEIIIAQLEAKVTQLEAQLELNNQLGQDLTFKLTQLEAKNVQLEVNIQEQGMILTSLLPAAELPVSATGWKSSPNNGEIAIPSIGKSGTPRTCRELKAADPSLPSGMHWIDPDGQGLGDDPIYVYCDMTLGSTSILHDSESSLDVGHCADPGCYSRLINYTASIGQMKALAELSTECHQSVKYDCYYTPFELNGVAYSWWNDREGNAQYFWAGSNADGVHTCRCGIDGNCVDSAVKCNCDTISPIQLVDSGVITDKNVLPVTRLNFGRTQLETSSGVHTLGRFECTGTGSFTGLLPKSCQDLWLIGHTLNGFYSIKGVKMMESVFCDFTKLQSDEGFQKWIGYSDVKSSPVYFFVQKNTRFSDNNIPIPFDVAQVNVGNAMDLSSGVFTARRPGIYFFSFTTLAYFPASSDYTHLGIFLHHNNDRIAFASVEEASPAYHMGQLSVQSTLSLKPGDRVWVQIYAMAPGVYLYDNQNHNIFFTGFMLEEEIVASL